MQSRVDKEPGRPTVIVPALLEDCVEEAFFGAQAASEVHIRTAAETRAAAFMVMRDAGIQFSFVPLARTEVHEHNDMGQQLPWRVVPRTGRL